jgi:ribonuclease PH
MDAGMLKTFPLNDSVAAVSVGVVGGMPLLDLEYAEDVDADVDMNVVMTGAGRLIEVQATAERVPFDRQTLDQLLDLSAAGIRRITDEQIQVVARSYTVAGDGS